MSEKKIMHEIMLAATQHGARLFRNHVGTAWHGTSVTRFTHANRIAVEVGDVLLKNGRPVKSGFGVGSSDLIGWAPRVVTQEDVGKTLAVFLACEVKGEGGILSSEQSQFLIAVERANGISVEARSVEEFLGAIKNG